MKVVCFAASLLLAAIAGSAQEAQMPAAAKPAPEVAIVNGRPYVRPTAKQELRAYLRDTYGLPALARTMFRAGIGQATDRPEQWGQDGPGFGQRLGSAEAITLIDGNVRYGLATLFKEDVRYIPCHGCDTGDKFSNAFVSEFTARHDRDGHRFFSLTQIVGSATGPLVADATWFPGRTAADGVRSIGTVIGTRIGSHLIREFLLERRHKDPPFHPGSYDSK